MTHSSPPTLPDTRERLLDTAERLFAARGFAGTSVREITDAAGANLGAVNYYFRSKEILYAEVFARRAALLREPVLAAAREALDVARTNPEQALETLGRAFLAPHEDRDASRFLLGLFAREAIEACLPPGTFVRSFLLPAIEAIASIVRQARPDLPEAAARACAALVLRATHAHREGCRGRRDARGRAARARRALHGGGRPAHGDRRSSRAVAPPAPAVLMESVMDRNTILGFLAVAALVGGCGKGPGASVGPGGRARRGRRRDGAPRARRADDRAAGPDGRVPDCRGAAAGQRPHPGADVRGRVHRPGGCAALPDRIRRPTRPRTSRRRPRSPWRRRTCRRRGCAPNG